MPPGVKVQVLSSAPSKIPVLATGILLDMKDLVLHVNLLQQILGVKGRGVSDVRESSVSYFLVQANGGATR